MNLYEQQASNRRRTWLVMAIFIALLALLGAGFDWYLFGAPTPFGVGVALAVGSASAASSYFQGDRAVIGSTKARPLADLQAASASDDERLKLRQLENVVDEMRIASGLPQPKVFVVPDPDPNAFATGRDPDHASIAVTRGLLDTLNREELQAVVAHELSHVRNYDIRLMTVVAALVGTVALLSDWTMRTMRFGTLTGGRRRGRDSSDGGGAGILGIVLMVVWIVAIVLAPVAARVLAMTVSRSREYLADASAAEMTRHPGALASALEKIEAVAGPTRSIKRGTAHLCIADPLERTIDLKEGYWADLFATHPPMPKRIEALRRMAYQWSGPERATEGPNGLS